VSYIVADLSKLKTFGEIYRMLMGNLVEDLTQGLNVLSIHAGAIMLIKSFLGKSEKERAAITTNLASHLEIWGNPLIDKATSCSDFNPINFRKEKSTLYVGLRPCDINRLRPLMRFFYQHIAQTLTLTTPDENTEPHGILFLLDEFPTLGHMNIFTTCIPYFRGYKIRLFIVTQDLNDLQSSYGESGANTLLANCNFKVAFTPNNWETAKLIADLSITSQPEVLMRMKSDQQIFIIDGDYPLICRKMIYFSRVEFRDKLMEAVKLEFKN
jgi:type IV secretion system protein VirD4